VAVCNNSISPIRGKIGSTLLSVTDRKCICAIEDTRLRCDYVLEFDVGSNSRILGAAEKKISVWKRSRMSAVHAYSNQ